MHAILIVSAYSGGGFEPPFESFRPRFLSPNLVHIKIDPALSKLLIISSLAVRMTAGEPKNAGEVR